MTSIDPFQDLQHPPLDLAGPQRRHPAVPRPPAGVRDHGGEVAAEELEHEDGVLVLPPEVLVEQDDVGGAAEDLEGLDLAEGGLVVVDLLEGDGEAVGEAAAAVDVGVGAGADALQDLVPGDDLPPGVDAPALRRVRVRVHRSSKR